MKLNPDCIRDILLTVEDTISFGTYMHIDSEHNNYPLLTKYELDYTLYHIQQCELSGLLTKVSWFMGPGCLIYDLSPEGHEFLANIRSEENWSKTKEVAAKVGSFSLDVLTKIAVSVISSLINKHI